MVEDEVLIRLMVAEELREEGFVVVEAANADEAVRVLESPVRIDVVLTDIRMAGIMDGVDLARLVRAEHPQVGMILASALAPGTLDGTLFDAFFRKPYTPADVVGWIKRRLDQAVT